MSAPRSLRALWLLVMLAPLAHADDSNSPAKKPAAAATPPSKAAEASKPAAPGPDDDLLEFLGSVGEDTDGEWIDYLSTTDISKVARTKKPPAPAEVSK